MPSPSRRPSARSGLTGPAAILAAIVLLVYGLLTGNVDVSQIMSVLNGVGPDASTPAAATPSGRATPTPVRATPSAARFDYYVLALSWSPEYCAGEGADDRQQCSPGMKLGFVLHGLWPQSEGSSPGFCSSQGMPQSAEDKYPGVYPTEALLEHEWEKHGTCSGLTPEQYLALSKRLKESVRVPDAYQSPVQAFRATTAQVEAAFVAANPGHSASSVAVICSGDGRYLREVYVCFDRDGKPTACDRGVDRDAANSCDRRDFQVRSPR